MNQSDIINQFTDAMREAGITPPNRIIADGTLKRFHIQGQKQGSLNGYYLLHLDGVRPAGHFGDYSSGLKTNWKYGGEVKQYTPEEKREYARQKAETERKRQAEETAKHLNAAQICSQIWAKTTPALDHPYLSKKRIQAHGARLYTDCFPGYSQYKGCLVLPLYDAALRVTSLEFIWPNGKKRFFGGGKKAGCFWWIGTLTDKILIAEGYATACTLHECTGLRVIVAYDAGNLLKVAQIVRAKYPSAELVVCSDHDTSGTGQAKAEEAALAVNGLVAMPPEPDTDFNDLFVKGLEHKEGV